MRCSPIAVGAWIVLATACRAAAPVAPVAPDSSDSELDRARASCQQGELSACDHFELERAWCLEHPEGPTCEGMRRRGELPLEPPPLAEAFGCWSTEGPIGPRAVICLAEDRISVRDAAGHWDQWRITGWQREDTPQRAIWVAASDDGASLWLTSIETTGTPSASGPLFWPSRAYHVVGAGGLLRATLGDRDPEADDVLATLPRVEDVCGHADACELAIAASRATPVAGEDEIEGTEPLPSNGPRTLQQCHARWSTAAHEQLAPGTHGSLPAACGLVRNGSDWTATVDPPYPAPPRAW